MIFLILTLCFSIYTLMKFKSVINPFFLFNLVWTIVLLLSQLNLYDLLPPSDLVMSIVFTGILSFNVPVLFVREKRRVEQTKVFVYNRVTIVLALAATVIVSIYFGMKSYDSLIYLLSGGSLSEIRNLYFDTNYGSRNDIEYYFENFIAIPFLYAAFTYSSQYYKNKILNKYILYISLISIMLYSIYSGGRFVLLNILIILFVIYHRKFTFKKMIPIIVLVSFIFLLSIFRSGIEAEDYNYLDFFKTTVIYYTGSLSYVSEIFRTFSTIGKQDILVNTFGGFIFPFVVFGRALNVFSYPEVFNHFTYFTTTQLRIGEGVYFNAFPTMFFSFFLDGGYILVSLYSILFSVISWKLYNLSNFTKYSYLSGTFALFSIQIINSSIKWLFFSPSFALSLIYLLMFYFFVGKERIFLERGSNYHANKKSS